MPIPLDSDVGSNEEFDNVKRGTLLNLTMCDVILSYSYLTFNIVYIPYSTYNISIAKPTRDKGLH